MGGGLYVSIVTMLLCHGGGLVVLSKARALWQCAVSAAASDGDSASCASCGLVTCQSSSTLDLDLSTRSITQADHPIIEPSKKVSSNFNSR